MFDKAILKELFLKKKNISFLFLFEKDKKIK